MNLQDRIVRSVRSAASVQGLTTLVLIAAVTSTAHAQSGGGYDLAWNSVDGGGEVFSTGNGYRLGGAIGQPDGGEMSAFPYGLHDGFWVIPTTAQGEGPSDAPMTGDDTCWLGTVDTGVPCSTDLDCFPGEKCGVKNRYITITPSNADDGSPTAIKVTIVASLVDPLRIGDVWWAGSEQTLGNAPNGNLTAAITVCSIAPLHSQVWTPGFLHLFGPEIVPGSLYLVQMYRSDGAACSAGLLVATGKWGDVVAPFGVPGQPDFIDISAVVDKFTNSGSAPDTPRADLRGREPPALPNTADGVVDFVDVGAVVDAFSGDPYPHPIPSCGP